MVSPARSSTAKCQPRYTVATTVATRNKERARDVRVSLRCRVIRTSTVVTATCRLANADTWANESDSCGTASRCARCDMYLACVSWTIVCGSPTKLCGAEWNGPSDGMA